MTMAEKTAIGWTDHTFNPWWGCVKISPACDSCYAERDAHRYGFADGGGNGPELWGPGSERRRLSEKAWAKPLRWDAAAAEAGRKALVFCASMADVFEARDDLDPERARLWELIEQTPNLIWLLLTKRPEQVLRRVPQRWIPGTEAGCEDPSCGEAPLDHAWPENVWIGTTVEDQARAELRIPRLLSIPAPVRFLSCEPLLGPVDLTHMDVEGRLEDAYWINALSGRNTDMGRPCRDAPSVGWVIIGGESGPGFRPMELEHARSLAAQARAAGVPVYFKQVSGPRSGAPGPEDLEKLKAWPPEAGERGSWVEIR